jgi:hypothetical protein
MAYSTQDLRNLATSDDEIISDAIGGIFVSRKVINSWRLLSITQTGISKGTQRMALRLNCFANLYYFARVVLRLDKLQTNPDLAHNLHWNMCAAVMKDGLKEVIEIPRDHYKSTIYSQAFPLWRALPFLDSDAEALDKLGYPSIYIEWMRRCHNQDVRILLVSETQQNAVKLGTKLRTHYQNNSIFRSIFPEIIPDASCTWKDDSLHQRRTEKGRQHGEGTFDLIGVGGALQSRHYDIAVEDDLVGKKALNSEAHMEATIEYHQLLVGAMDAAVGNGGRDNDEIVVGNRWSYKDLNSHIRNNETYFNFVTHSALGGCCSLHTYGLPIFPEAFTVEKLARWRARLGTRLFSCQFLNFPINPEQCKFDINKLRRYKFVRDTSASTGGQQPYSHLTGLARVVASTQQRTWRPKIVHQVAEGVVVKDIFPRNLDRYMIVDPNHSGKKGRCRNAITVTGVDQETRYIYLLDVWAKSCDPAQFVETMFRMAVAWKINRIHLETVAAQKYLAYHLRYFIDQHKSDIPEIAHIQIVDLKYDNNENAKKTRIESLEPIFLRGEFWINDVGMTEFLEEYEAYGNTDGKIDVLDTLGYGPDVWKLNQITENQERAMIIERQARFERALRQSTYGLAS